MITAFFIIAFGLSVSRGLRKTSVQAILSQNQKSVIEMVTPVRPIITNSESTIHLHDYITERNNINKSIQSVRLLNKELSDIPLILN